MITLKECLFINSTLNQYSTNYILLESLENFSMGCDLDEQWDEWEVKWGNLRGKCPNTLGVFR